MWSHLEHIAGGATSAASAVGAIGTRGPGEKQLEIDRRLVQKRVSALKREIEEIDRRKLREVKSRKDVFSVCLVGYTNAGKSTLMNLLTGADTYVADKLFATLDTKTRRWNMGEGQSVLLSDTVGFVANLPHHLVASFRATLEEAIHGNLLLHVADASHERVEHQIAAVEEVLDQLGCDRSKVLLVLNKTDRIKDPTLFTLLDKKYPGSVFVSALSGSGAEKLLEEVLKRSGGRNVRVRLRANFRNGKLMGFLAQHAKVETQTYDDSTTQIEASMSADKIEMLRTFGKDVEIVKA
jgi:GTP-binding protein HflX